MTVNDLLQKVSVKALTKAADKYYEDYSEGFSDIYRHLKKLKPTKSDVILSIAFVDTEVDGSKLPAEDCYYEVMGHREGDEELCSCSLCPWTEWLAMEINPVTLQEYSPAIILAHCIFDMTFYGTTPKEVQAVADELQRRSAEIDTWIAEGTLDKHTVPLEELVREFDINSKKIPNKA